MPHVIVKLWPGPSEQAKQQLAEAITKDVMKHANVGEDSVSVSVSIEEVRPADWTEQVYDPDIAAKRDTLYKKPGYQRFWRGGRGQGAPGERREALQSSRTLRRCLSPSRAAGIISPMAKDGLGDRCKDYELAEAGRRAMRGLPLLARLDGRAFHTFTRDLRRPYEHGMSIAMIETTRYLVQEMTALVGYTQSDEITLAWFESSQSASEYPFDGRFQKLASVLAGMASAKFYQLVLEHLPQKATETPHFDCRVWQVPTLDDAAEVFIWREDDATKNSITMAAGAHYTEAELTGKNSNVKQEMLFQRGVNWNDFPSFFKRGSYLQRRTSARTLTDEERARIPEPHRPPIDATFQRTQVVELDLPPVRKIANLSAVLFERADPAPRS